MIEKSWAAISAQSFTANGTAYGVVTLASTFGFYTKQIVIIKATALPDLLVQIKRVNSDGLTMIVGPADGNISTWQDISLYTTAASSTIQAPEQRRVAIPVSDIQRAVYEEEPAVAMRVILVDESGNKITQANPLFVKVVP